MSVDARCVALMSSLVAATVIFDAPLMRNSQWYKATHRIASPNEDTMNNRQAGAYRELVRKEERSAAAAQRTQRTVADINRAENRTQPTCF
jgi:hypothetical protein